MPSQTKPSLVFCHGILADGSCFNKVMPTFQAEGHEVISAQYPLDSNVEDVAATRDYLNQVSSPAILIGHSYGALCGLVPACRLEHEAASAEDK
jgi:pimeloyl-ACP methyl ester carboxylesterase